MAIVTLNGELRDRRGKGAAREARRQGKVPGVLYGKGEEGLPINVGSKELVTVLHGHAGSNVILDVKLAGQEGGTGRRSFASSKRIRSRAASPTSTSCTSR
jgi:ribosomal protein L25 (general stress protein Ctc)